jgi:hypothetical protein
MGERPPVDPPPQPNRPDPEGKVRVLWERGSWSNNTATCIWHTGCQKMRGAPMRIVEDRDDSVLLECCACGKRAVWPVDPPHIRKLPHAGKLCDEDTRGDE